MWILRSATVADVPAIHASWLLTDFPDAAERAKVATLGEAPWFGYLVAHGTMLVAEVDGHIIGFAATITRGRMCYLAECFVQPTWQSQGVTKALLAQLFADPTLVRCTLASSDPRAVSRYMRVGMRPQWPMYFLSLHDASRLGDTTYSVRETTDVEAWLHYDRRLVGHDRAVDITDYFVAHCQAALLQIYAGAQLVGQSLVQRRHYDPDMSGAMNVSLTGVFDAQHAAGAMHAAVVWTHALGAPHIHMRVPAAHAGLPLLIERGMHIAGVETFCASQMWFDPTCYAPSGMM